MTTFSIDEQDKLKKSISDQKDIMRKKQNAVDEIDASEDLAEQVAQKLKQEVLGGSPSGDNKEK
ncbi:MAG: hypothetical protein IIB07_09400 [Bacteroidetes bacterium]|nr:hypothetical protein [Bacteroidota bacterium]